jgi:hypothetical protein
MGEFPLRITSQSARDLWVTDMGYWRATKHPKFSVSDTVLRGNPKNYLNFI